MKISSLFIRSLLKSVIFYHSFIKMSPNAVQVTPSPDVMGKTAELQRLLLFHDKAIQQIIFLDSYIKRLNTAALMSLFNGNGSHAIRLTNRKTIAEGLKYKYKYYRLLKWYEVQQLVTGIMHSTTVGDNTSVPRQPRAPKGHNIEKMYDFAPGIIYSQSGRRRCD